MWAALIQEYWQVSTFKRSPADTPYSPLLLGIMMIFFLLILIVQWRLIIVEKKLTLSMAFLAGTSLIFSYIFFTSILLALFRLGSRTVQTLTSLFAGHTIVHLFAFPLLLLGPILVNQALPQPLILLMGIVYLLSTLLLTFWQFSISAYVYKHALMVDYFPAVLASIGLLAVNILVMSFWR
ncbi:MULTISPECIES: hypothetical protein [Legionella]|uniref:Yip1 domain-containing protein n=1 Tax=Legionella septentrionalis TaxID=2498109 RepID=A0A433JKT7_9GAMM|nr:MULTISPECIES: hypothetical protein [Legionella]MCP0914295.1 hypothetical protein [Legionella sp. 27cVA30]RUQ89043.1 hypothetical protein EKM59_04400 [Legionella septentrionalis]RUR00626.1 hypothetical protein ELY11_02420 [Legionella septentrionalis]RUR11793.1 hypothetical protein ELY14_00690 [Legionella septentrionalis]RUR17481.1 hypothetical protein ELY10_00690 [Legionella septentrionalis]